MSFIKSAYNFVNRHINKQPEPAASILRCYLVGLVTACLYKGLSEIVTYARYLWKERSITSRISSHPEGTVILITQPFTVKDKVVTSVPDKKKSSSSSSSSSSKKTSSSSSSSSSSSKKQSTSSSSSSSSSSSPATAAATSTAATAVTSSSSTTAKKKKKIVVVKPKKAEGSPKKGANDENEDNEEEDDDDEEEEIGEDGQPKKKQKKKIPALVQVSIPSHFHLSVASMNLEMYMLLKKIPFQVITSMEENRTSRNGCFPLIELRGKQKKPSNNSATTASAEGKEGDEKNAEEDEPAENEGDDNKEEDSNISSSSAKKKAVMKPSSNLHHVTLLADGSCRNQIEFLEKTFPKLCDEKKKNLFATKLTSSLSNSRTSPSPRSLSASSSSSSSSSDYFYEDEEESEREAEVAMTELLCEKLRFCLTRATLLDHCSLVRKRIVKQLGDSGLIPVGWRSVEDLLQYTRKQVLNTSNNNNNNNNNNNSSSIWLRVDSSVLCLSSGSFHSTFLSALKSLELLIFHSHRKSLLDFIFSARVPTKIDCQVAAVLKLMMFYAGDPEFRQRVPALAHMDSSKTLALYVERVDRHIYDEKSRYEIFVSSPSPSPFASAFSSPAPPSSSSHSRLIFPSSSSSFSSSSSASSSSSSASAATAAAGGGSVAEEEEEEKEKVIGTQVEKKQQRKKAKEKQDVEKQQEEVEQQEVEKQPETEVEKENQQEEEEQEQEQEGGDQMQEGARENSEHAQFHLKMTPENTEALAELCGASHDHEDDS